MKKYKDIPACIEAWVKSVDMWNRVIDATLVESKLNIKLTNGKMPYSTLRKIAWGSLVTRVLVLRGEKDESC